VRHQGGVTATGQTCAREGEANGGGARGGTRGTEARAAGAKRGGRQPRVASLASRGGGSIKAQVY
jgi:hypothetical protein